MKQTCFFEMIWDVLNVISIFEESNLEYSHKCEMLPENVHLVGEVGEVSLVISVF